MRENCVCRYSWIILPLRSRPTLVNPSWTSRLKRKRKKVSLHKTTLSNRKVDWRHFKQAPAKLEDYATHKCSNSDMLDVFLLLSFCPFVLFSFALSSFCPFHFCLFAFCPFYSFSLLAFWPFTLLPFRVGAGSGAGWGAGAGQWVVVWYQSGSSWLVQINERDRNTHSHTTHYTIHNTH